MMFGLFKKKKDPRLGTYNGEGIWAECPDCGNMHPADEQPEFRTLLEDLCTEVGDSSAEIYEAFGIGDPKGRWDCFPEEGMFCFTNADGAKCHARYGVVGSWAPHSHSWMWAWGMDTDWLPTQARSVTQTAFDIGQANGWTAVTSKMLLVDEHEAWHLTKLAAHLSGMPMVYSAMVNDINRHFFAIDRPVWEN